MKNTTQCQSIVPIYRSAGSLLPLIYYLYGVIKAQL